MGPVFLDWDGSYQTYSDFLFKVRISLGHSFPIDKIIFGLDEEQALLNALRPAFPESTQILCTRHLYENMNRNLNKANVPEQIQKILSNQLFGKNGILTLSSRVAFIERKQEILKQFINIGNGYLRKKLLPVLFKSVFLPKLENPSTSIPHFWKNNNC